MQDTPSNRSTPPSSPSAPTTDSPTDNPSATELSSIVARAARGDHEAVQTLLSRYSRMIERELWTQRRFHGLQARLDPDDIAQSVWRCFFTSLVGGEIVFREANEVAAFLIRLTRNRIETQFRKHHAIKRDIRKTVNSHTLDDQPNLTNKPDHFVSTIEFLQAVLERMTPEERHISQRREEGATWEQLATELCLTPEALRKRHTRMAQRILGELDPEHEST